MVAFANIIHITDLARRGARADHNGRIKARRSDGPQPDMRHIPRDQHKICRTIGIDAVTADPPPNRSKSGVRHEKTWVIWV